MTRICVSVLCADRAVIGVFFFKHVSTYTSCMMLLNNDNSPRVISVCNQKVIWFKLHIASLKA